MNRRIKPQNRKASRNMFLPLAIAAVMGAGAAFAQVHQVDLSNPMDANPGVGTGGANQGVQGYVPINGNDVMTGNTAGLKYFHGQQGRPGNQTGLGTFSPYEFSGPQGSAALQDFGRLTAGGGVNGAVNQAYFLPSTTVSTGGGTLYSAPINGGFDSGLVPASVVNPSAAQQSDLLTQNQQQYGAAYGGIDRAPAEVVNPGDPGAVLQSPLFWERTKAALLAQEQANQAYQGAATPGGAATMPGAAATQPWMGGTEIAPVIPDQVQGTVDQGVKVEISGEPNEVKNATAGHKSVDATVSHTTTSLLAALDQASGTEAGTPGTTGTTGANDQGSASPDKGGLGSDNGTEIAIDPLTGNPRNVHLPKPGTTAGAGGTGETAAGGTGTGMMGAGTGAGRGANGGMGGSGMGGGSMTSGTTGRGTSTMGPGLSAGRLEDAPDSELRAGSKVKPVKLAEDTALQGSGASRFDVMMSQGDLDLRQGKYLDAAQSFQAAMASKPDDPLAVVGRAHAEMGAGMYASAAFDLKFVFTRKPELMGVKYDVGSFIPAGRQAFLLQDLKKLTSDKDAGDMASFLYAYLCYQTGRTDLLQGELGAWGTQSGHDQWQSVATRAWGAAAQSQ